VAIAFVHDKRSWTEMNAIETALGREIVRVETGDFDEMEKVRSMVPPARPVIRRELMLRLLSMLSRLSDDQDGAEELDISPDDDVIIYPPSSRLTGVWKAR
jgi:hypothetical protein